MLLLGTLACGDQANVFRCSDAASCDANGVAGTCESTGFCSFPDPSCPSGQRYGEFAGSGFAGGCVAEDPVGSTSLDTTSGSGTTGPMSTTVLPDTSATDPSTTSVSTTGMSTTNAVDDSGTTDPTDPTNATDPTNGTDPTNATDPTNGTDPTDPTTESGSTTGDETTGDSMVTGDPPPGPACANFTWETTIGAGTSVPSADFFGDVLDTSCGAAGGADIVWYWVAQNNNTYLFTTNAPAGLDLVISLYDDCDGTEQTCTATNELEIDAVAGEEYFFVVNAYGDTSQGYSVSFSAQ